MPSSLQHALRSLRRRPALAAVAVSTIALAVAGNAAILAMVDAVLLEPLPFEEPERLVTLDVKSPQGFYISTSIPNLRDWRDRGRSFDSYAGAAAWSLTLLGDGPPEVVEARAVLGDLFGVLGLQPLHGRVFAADETERGARSLALLGHAFWQRRFGGDPAVVGTAIQLDGSPFEVVGILPRGAGWPSALTDLYVPMGVFDDQPWDDRDSSWGTRVVARLAPGSTVALAQADLDRVTAEVEAEVGEAIAHPEARALHDFFLGELRPRAFLLFAAVLFVLLIAMANVANLLLARGETRRSEILLRQALGARHSVLVRELMAESLLLCALGGALGLGIAAASLGLLRPILTQGMPALAAERLALDGSVVLLTVALVAGAGTLAGLLPALRGVGRSFSADLRESGRGIAGARSRLRSALVVAELALALVVTIGAALSIQSLRALARVEKGFEAEQVLTARVAYSPERFPERDGWLRFYGDLAERVAALPGVRSAAVSLLVPLSGRNWEMRASPEGRPPGEEGDSVLFGLVSDDYFETVGLPLFRGRGWAASDHNESTPVVVVDETMAEKFWPDEDPLGKRISLDEGTPESPVWRTVVGVTRNLRHYELSEPSRIQAYVPVRQSLERWGMGLSIVIRTSVPPESMVAPLRDAVAAIDPETALHEVRTLQGYVDDDLAPTRSLAGLLAGFGGLSLLLSGIGTFAVLSYHVARRTREIGVRLALGADRGRLVRWVTWEGLRLAASGLVLGLAAAAALSRYLGSLLFEVEPLAPGVYLAAAAALLLVATLAVLIPAVRAARMSPLEALATEG